MGNVLPIKAEFDLENYPAEKPGVKLSLNKVTLFGDEEDPDMEDQANDILKEIYKNVGIISEDGTVDMDKLNLQWSIEGEPDEDDDDDEEDDEDDTVYPLQHIMNKLWVTIKPHMS